MAQCASSQFAAARASTTRGTLSATAGSAARSMTLAATRQVSAASASGTSKTSSSCTCSSIRADRPAAFRAAGMRIIARRMTSAAVPWMGALMAARSANWRWAGEAPRMSGILTFRPKSVAT